MGLTKHGLPSSAALHLLLAQERSGIAAVPSRCLLKLAGSRGSGTWGRGAPRRLPYSSLLRQSSLAFGAEVLVIFLSLFSVCVLAATTAFTLLSGCQPSFQEFAATNLTCLAFAFIHATRLTDNPYFSTRLARGHIIARANYSVCDELCEFPALPTSVDLNCNIRTRALQKCTASL